MKRKLVLWGENDRDEKKLIALELIEKENNVKIYTFDQEIATQEFYKEMMDNWREDREVQFPEGFETIEKPLKVSDGLLPENLKVERTDLISRAQAEWHFIVLSGKLYEIYSTELADLEEKVQNLEVFNIQIWNEMKNYWGKVMEQVHEKNLFQGHADSLKKRTNQAFEQLKEMRKKLDEELEVKSKEVKQSFMDELDDIEGKIEKKLGLKPLFAELKSLQTKLRSAKLTRSDNNAVWNRIDKAFKEIKKIKYGDQGGDTSTELGRVTRRYEGLMNAIQKMERSIKIDRSDLSFQEKRIDTTDGQLEMQLRQAKAKVIEERVNSKQEKLDDMLKTKTMLEEKIEREKQKEADRERAQKVEEAKKAAKEKIAAEIESQKVEAEKISKKLEEAAAEIKGNVEISYVDKSELISDTDTIEKHEVVVDNTDESTIDSAKDNSETETNGDDDSQANKVIDTAKNTLSAAAIIAKDEIQELVEDIPESLDKAKEVIESIANVAQDKIEEIISDLTEEEE